MSEMICPHCGAENPVDALICRACFRSLYEEPDRQDQDEAEEPQEISNATGEDTQGIESDTGAEEGIPEWLARIRARAREEASRPAEEAPQSEEGQDLTDWLQDLKDQQESLPPEKEPESDTDWLSRITTLKSQDQAQEERGSFEAAEGTGEGLPGESHHPAEEESSDLPDWLLEGNVEPEEPISEAEFAQLPDWLFDEETLSSQPETGGGAEPIFPSPGEEILNQPGETPLFPEEELPDWLRADEGKTSQKEPEIPSESTLEPAQVPGWLQSMRPIDFSIPRAAATYGDEAIETSGPLAGYQGVLPGTNAVTRYSKPPVYGDNLVVSEKQRIYSALFDTLIADEKRAVTAAPTRETGSSRGLQLVIGILMFGMIIFTLVLNPNIAILPTLYSPENVAFLEAIQDLKTMETPGRILIGLDYEPSLSGEVSKAAEPVLEDLMAVNSGLVFVSLRPTGPAMAADLTSRASQAVPEYDIAERVVQLGYLAGGASGLAGLAVSPRQVAASPISGPSVWDKTVLEGINQVSDFDAVLLLTDNTESARDWIEQIQTSSSEVPFLLVTSSQAAPALQPYVQSGQVAGMIAGWNGSTAYQTLAGNSPGTLDGTLDAYQMGVLLSAALILIGAIVNGIKVLLPRSKKA
jgi:hypothetical protein